MAAPARSHRREPRVQPFSGDSAPVYISRIVSAKGPLYA